MDVFDGWTVMDVFDVWTLMDGWTVGPKVNKNKTNKKRQNL